MSAVIAPDEEESYLLAILDGADGIDLSEFVWVDEEQDDGCFRVWDFQWPWYTCEDPLQIDQCGRSLGKSTGIQMRAFAFPFNHAGAEMLITAPELNHLRPLTDTIEARILATRLSREMLPRTRGNGLSRQPHWQARFTNGARIMSRLPNKDGKGVKGQHPLVLESDEMQDYPLAGWIELVETLKRGSKGAQWRAHGVARGVHDKFYEYTQDDSDFTVHRFMAPHRPSWTAEERKEKIKTYGGSSQNSDYKRNIYGEHGDATNPVFVLARLMACWASATPISTLNGDEVVVKPIQNIRVGDKVVNAIGAGEVTAIIPSERNEIVEVIVHGERLHCTPEHPFFTGRGWVAADQLQAGDALIDHEGVRALWESADLAVAGEVLFQAMRGGAAPSGPTDEHLRDLRSADEGVEVDSVLLSGVLEAGRAQDVRPLSGVRQGDYGAAADHLFTRVRCVAQTAGESTPGQRVPVLREAHSARQGQLPVLRSDLLERESQADDPSADVQAVRGGLPSEAAASVLLAELLSEVGRDHLRWSGGRPRHEDLQALRDRVLAGGQEGQVLLTGVCERGVTASEDSAAGLSAVRDGVPAVASDAHLLQEGVLVRGEGEGPPNRAATLDEHGAGRAAGGSAFAVAGTGGARGGLGTGVLDVPVRAVAGFGDCGGDPFCCRHSASGQQDGGRGGWDRACAKSGQGARRGPRRVAAFPRVDRVEILQPGSAEFDRLSGGKDTVTVYDLTVSGHPSFMVGESQLLVHNCVDTEEGDEFNTEIYQKITIDFERLQGTSVATFLDLPGTHLTGWKDAPKGYSAYYGGADIGMTNHPSEFLVFGVRMGTGVHDLLLRVHMERVDTDGHMELLDRLFTFYGEKLKGFGLDRTGLGFSIAQMADNCWYGKRFHGYNFSEKVAVGFREPAQGEDPNDLELLAEMRNVVEHSTDVLRNLWVDPRKVWVPFDRELLAEWQGQNYTLIKSTGSPYGKRDYARGKFHTLDAAKMAAAAETLPPIQALIDASKAKEAEPIMDMFAGSF